MAEEPKVPLFYARREGARLAFLCPHCKIKHYHGIAEGFRKAHCVDGPYVHTGYNLIVEKVRRR